MSNAALLIEAKLKALMQAAMGGCPRSYHRFLSDLTPLLRGYFRRRISHSMADVEDLTQEVLMALHRRRESYDPSFPVTAWVYGIARYKLIDLYRSMQREPEWVDWTECEAFPASSMALAPDGTEAQTDVLALLAELPGGQREAIRLVKLEGWSVLEASQMTGQSEAAVKVNIHRGLRRLSAICQEGSR